MTRKFELNFAAVDATCHSELPRSLGLEPKSFPVFLIIDSQRKTLTVHSGSFNYDQLTQFINTVLRGKASSGFYAGLEFEDKACKSEESEEVKGKKAKKKLNKQENLEL